MTPSLISLGASPGVNVADGAPGGRPVSHLAQTRLGVT